ncbi:hypothetical protein VPH35_085757 [Triticum aestivum]
MRPTCGLTPSAPHAPSSLSPYVFFSLSPQAPLIFLAYPSMPTIHPMHLSLPLAYLQSIACRRWKTCVASWQSGAAHMKPRRCVSTTLGERRGATPKLHRQLGISTLQPDTTSGGWFAATSGPYYYDQRGGCAVKMDDGCGDFCAETHDSLCYNRPAILLEPASIFLLDTSVQTDAHGEPKPEHGDELEPASLLCCNEPQATMISRAKSWNGRPFLLGWAPKFAGTGVPGCCIVRRTGELRCWRAGTGAQFCWSRHLDMLEPCEGRRRLNG